MISDLITAHRSTVLADEANFDDEGNPLDPAAVEASEKAEREAFTRLVREKCRAHTEVQEKVDYLVNGTIGRRSLLLEYLFEYSEGDLGLLGEFLCSLILKANGPAEAATSPSHGSTNPTKD
ncbi:hypothetical protein N182_28770 [Sinorhizobium sp. GL2]|nr:hypothetical protein N182_28770 [Sinorhizobium sp. GL2]